MIGLRHARAFMAGVALLLDAHTGVWAQASNERTDTFEQRFPPDQVTTPPGGEQPPRQPPVRQAPIPDGSQRSAASCSRSRPTPPGFGQIVLCRPNAWVRVSLKRARQDH